MYVCMYVCMYVSVCVYTFVYAFGLGCHWRLRVLNTLQIKIKSLKVKSND